ncbi:MAG TPA: YigZ family protein [bacterium]|nr:YigZ family protein [bacterium]
MKDPSEEIERFFTINGTAQSEIRVKSSRFIGRAQSIRSHDEAEAFIDSIRRRFHDATHHCYAYRIGLPPDHRRYSDNGEPSGTAGRPIMEMLSGRCLTDIVLIVTRYFGGVKLGTGGLARAYSRCAAATLDNAQIHALLVTETVRVAFDYGLTGSVMKTAERNRCTVKNMQYGQKTELTLEVEKTKSDAFIRELIDQTAGKAKVISRESSHD